MAEPDANDTYTYAITAGDPAGAFAVDNAGNVRVADGSQLDYETQNSYSLTIQVLDDVYDIEAVAGEPLHILTLASQLGLPYIDTVLELFDSQGKLVAEHDDVMTGQGTVIGNPDSSLFYVPQRDEPLKLVVRDRIGRGGPTFQYRLRVRRARPGFQLLVEPENFTVPRGSAADLTVFLIRQPGFEDDIEVWADGLPSQREALSGKFRADQFFGPSADGDNIIIPELTFRIEAPEYLTAGVYPFQVRGRAGTDGPVVKAHTSLWIGPPRKRNDIRRPIPSLTMYVVEPFEARLSTDAKRIGLAQGKMKEIEIAAKQVPKDAKLRIANAPTGVHHRIVSWETDQIVLALTAGEQAELGTTKISVEAEVDGRWAATPPITIVVSGKNDRFAASR